MIKVNLLDSVTDRAKGVAAVEEKVANPRNQTMLMALVIFGLLAAGMFYDYYSSASARDAQQSEKTEQEKVQSQMVMVNKERIDLEKKTNDIQARINAIQNLRASQQGPGTVLREMKSRIDSIPGLYLKSVEQKGGELTIKGESPNEDSVTKFAKSLEFSGGLFTNLSIETQREEAKVDSQSSSSSSSPSSATKDDPDAPKPEVVTFTIKCNYGPAASQPQPPAANAPAKPAAQPAAPPNNQVAQK
ncbi:MAG TPA: PilN domain-containing protein [Pyrinomonadaceae bacterium]|nr:PilN domain-containing protein [Pyrinomonadaceae bacterium]